jgi:hypothetical protein
MLCGSPSNASFEVMSGYASLDRVAALRERRGSVAVRCTRAASGADAARWGTHGNNRKSRRTKTTAVNFDG